MNRFCSQNSFPVCCPKICLLSSCVQQVLNTFQVGYNNPYLEDLAHQYCQDGQTYPDRCIGLGIIGDGVAHQTPGNVEVFSWNLINEASGGVRFLSAAVDKQYCCRCGCPGRHTTYHIYEGPLMELHLCTQWVLSDIQGRWDCMGQTLQG